MVSNLSKLDEVNVLASEANWAWPEALRDIFRPRGVNLLVAERAGGASHNDPAVNCKETPRQAWGLNITTKPPSWLGG